MTQGNTPRSLRHGWRRTAALAGPLRVALLAPSLHPGGAERQMLILASGLPRDEFQLRFIVMAEPGDLAPEAEALGIPVHALGLDRASFRGPRPSSVGGLARALRRYRRLTRDVDIVDGWLVPAYTLAGALQPFTRVPVLMAGRRSALDVHRTRTWYREAAGKIAMRQMDAIVANSQAAGAQAVADEGIDPARVHVIRNAVVPIPLAESERDALRDAWGFASEDLIVGCVGNYKSGKGHELLLEVAADLRSAVPRLRFVFVGDGELRPWLEEEIARRGLGSHVVLHSGERDARRLFGAFDIAVQASDSEGLPNAVLEAAAANLPIVATDVGGTSEIVNPDIDGMLVAKGDGQGIGRALTALATDAGLRRRLGDAAGRRAGDFSPARLALETGNLYARLAGR